MSPNTTSAPLRLVVGLGNPGREYANTRHNIGFMLVERMAARAGAQFRLEKPWKTEWTRVDDLLLCKPLTYMNLSGEAVRQISQFYKIEPAETLVVLDDLALPLGKLRLRGAGSAGGHNGLRSIIQHLGTSDVPRLRFGIGASQPGETVNHVLGRFTPEEQEPVTEALERAEAAVRAVQGQGLAAAMNAFN